MNQTVIQLQENFVGKFITQAEKLTDKIEKINRNLDKSYKEILAEAKENITADRKSQTLEEYKEFITEKILQTSINPSRFKDDMSVVMTDKTFAAMKANPEYESWVMNRLAEELNFPDYLCFYPGTYGRNEVYQFGETKEDYRGSSISKHKNNFPQPQEKSYWEVRLEKLKKRLEAEQEYFLHREELIKSAEKIAERRAAETLSDDTRPQLPISGVPASLLLDLL